MVSKKAARGKKLEPGKGDQLITNFFPRTKRIPAAVKRDEDLRRIHYHLDHGDPEEGFEVVTFEGKGKGVVTTRCFNKGDFVVEYAGELLTYKEAMEKEKEHEEKDRGCYMYFFEQNGRKWCVDATKPDKTLGRLINHSKKLANLRTKVIEHRKRPHLIFIASRDIVKGEELCYDYGERRKPIVDSLKWLNS